MPTFVVSLGDPAGIGPEVTARAWEQRIAADLPPFVAVGDIASVARVWGGPVCQVDDFASGLSCFDSALPVWHVADSGPVEPGEPTLAGAQCAMRSLELGIGMVRSGDAHGLITAPVSKDQLYRAGFTQPGQTEFIADHCGVSRANAVMMLAAPGLRVVPATIHIPFSAIIAQLSTDLIVTRGLATARGLTRSFGIADPVIAIAGLNPHGGENGALGQEEIDIIAPAVDQLRAAGVRVSGPHSPDAMFTPQARAGYDAALCLYHDQALIPFKALHFDDGVNVTLGLPIIRTSPDHGTAFNIAGKGLANTGPMIAAIRMAAEIARTQSGGPPCPTA